MRNTPVQTEFTDAEIDEMCLELWGNEPLLLLNPLTPERVAEREARETVRNLFEFTATEEFATYMGSIWG